MLSKNLRAFWLARFRSVALSSPSLIRRPSAPKNPKAIIIKAGFVSPAKSPMCLDGWAEARANGADGAVAPGHGWACRVGRQPSAPKRRAASLGIARGQKSFALTISRGRGLHAASALSAARGFLATMASSERAAGSGRTRPCSQLRSVASGILKACANSVCVI